MINNVFYNGVYFKQNEIDNQKSLCIACPEL